MVIGEAVVGNRVSYKALPTDGWFLLGCVTAINGNVVQVLFDRDIPSGGVTEVDPKTLTLSTDGGYLGDSQGPVVTS